MKSRCILKFRFTRSLEVIACCLLFSAASANLRPDAELDCSCFDFPNSNFNRKKNIKSKFGSSPHTGGGLNIGDAVLDFALNGPDGGESISLSGLLEDGSPVLLLWGMWTCPAYQGLGTSKPFDQCSYKHEWDLVEEYGDRVKVVHLVGPEPHPLAPDTNFDSGTIRMNYWSTVRQPRSYKDRAALARKISEFTHPKAFLLVDGLGYSQFKNQCVWCTMGLGARTALLISPDGTLVFKQDWFHKESAAKAIFDLLEKLGI
mmetsp:Transcript_25749/g.57732  ORF Transcript_25749/g.57732 Transcript_25749/m.57732 type:complete len:260 (+) Transcript_25749:133-912(+)